MKFRNSKVVKFVCAFLAITIVYDAVFPTIALALTTGPTQPEVQGFQPVGVSDMVDPFSGDFSYNIPLVDVGGYPLNISYSSAISMDQEASWVGLGWTLSPGAINRSVRGVPDDFDGDQVKRKSDMKPQIAYGVGGSIGFELYGFDVAKLNLSASLGIGYSNYDGYNLEFGLTPSLSSSKFSKKDTEAKASLGLSASSGGGAEISPNVSFSSKLSEKEKSDKLSFSLGGTYSSREGLKTLTLTGQSSKVSQATNGHIGEGSANMSFSTPIFMIRPESQTTNISLNFSASFGAEIFGADGNYGLNGYFSSQTINSSTRKYCAYGYLYENNSTDRDILDFNREKEAAFSKECPYLPLTNHSYDIYSVSGQGISGSYRPFRNDIGIIHDPSSTDLAGIGGSTGVEIAPGNLAHYGGQIVLNTNVSSSGLWKEGNKALDAIPFRSKKQLSNEENVYFKQAGEKTADKEIQRYNAIGGEDAIRMQIEKGKFGMRTSSANPVFYKNNGEKLDYSTVKKERTVRVSRNQNIEMLTADKAKDFALEKKILSYSLNTFTYNAKGYNSKKEIERLNDSSGKRAHHISEISTLKSDGSRYVFGIPAYNVNQDERSFTVNDSNANKPKGLVAFTGKYDIANTDKYFDQTITPAYAHSYLLTSVLSSDYEDVTQDGPSPDDIGSYTKLNYTRAASNYKWRTPYDSSNFSENFRTEKYDDKGNFVYGEKEIWYVHSIETKTHVAEFYLSKRDDALGVSGEYGGKDLTQTLYKLDSIKVFNREDKLTNGIKAVPVKVVHFEYDYSLCKGIPNSTSSTVGKLTLKKIYFTYGGSFKGKFTPYEFTYSKNNFNYNMKAYDRWGNYKPNDPNFPNNEFPYTDQNLPEATINSYAEAWCLKEISLPSGGKITVNYEADTYAYVQDKPAMQMFKVTGSGDSTTFKNGTSLLGNKYIYFELDPKSKNDIEYYKRDILTQKMYFKFLLNLGNDKNQVFEYVPSYVNILDIGLCGDNKHGYIELSNVGAEYKDNVGNVNPISKAGWTFIRASMPRMVSGQGSLDDKASFTSCLKAMVGTFKGIYQMFSGINDNLKERGLCNYFDPKKSWIRLYNPTGSKYGGGSRVKTIQISDEWTKMSNPAKTQTYGQEYSYTTTDGNNKDRIISSGVASYEPIIGGEENPFRSPIMLKHKTVTPGQPDFVENPLGESFFPSPSVGYSVVTVKSITSPNVTNHGTGKTINEFYTAKDFPTKVDYKPADFKRNHPVTPLSILKTNSIDYMVASQGYSVVLNDMHGKPKSTKVVPQYKDEAISEVHYYYEQKGNELSNDEYVLFKNNIDGIIKKEQIGVDYDLVSDMRYSASLMVSGGGSANIDSYIAGVIPTCVPTIFPSFQSEETGFNSVVMTKVVNKYGILTKTVASDLGSTISTTNLLYDGETGESILTETVNQFNDHVYNFTYPAHWAYTQMEPSYINSGIELNNTSIDLQKKFFTSGDELGIVQKNTKKIIRAWVNDVTPTTITAIDALGNSISVDEIYKTITILRSGRRNMQTLPIGTVSTMENPLKDLNKDGLFDKIELNSFSQVINASAIEYGSKWKLYCTCGKDYSTALYNPYLEGAKGKMKPLKSYVYLTERTQSNTKGKTDIRKDGIFANYSPFWLPPQVAGDNWAKDTTNWQYNSEVTQFSPHGFEIENKDPLNRYNSALYGYRNTQATAVANNAKVKEIGFDGFEDYLDSNECTDDHFSFRYYKKDNLTNSESHTGKYSIKVASKSKVQLRKVIKTCN